MLLHHPTLIMEGVSCAGWAVRLHTREHVSRDRHALCTIRQAVTKPEPLQRFLLGEDEMLLKCVFPQVEILEVALH